MARWYQNAVINGVTMPAQRRRDTSQKRWHDLVAPLIPPGGDGRLFMELGCNAGFYLRKAAELGYSTLGVEREPVYYEQAKYWEAQEPCGVRVEFGDLSEYEIPANYLTLIANVHYWLTPEQNVFLIERLRDRAMHVLIVSRHRSDERHKSDCAMDKVMEIFDGWELIDSRENHKHYSVIFRNPDLVEYDTANLFNIQPFIRSKRFLTAWSDYIDTVVSRRRFRLDHTDYWQYCTWRGWRERERNLRRLRRMILKAERDGIAEPLVVRENGLLVDGNHRLILAEYLGIKRMICRVSST